MNWINKYVLNFEWNEKFNQVNNNNNWINKYKLISEWNEDINNLNKLIFECNEKIN